jgi:hypothetical protein
MIAPRRWWWRHLLAVSLGALSVASSLFLERIFAAGFVAVFLGRFGETKVSPFMLTIFSIAGTCARYGFAILWLLRIACAAFVRARVIRLIWRTTAPGGCATGFRISY